MNVSLDIIEEDTTVTLGVFEGSAPGLNGKSAYQEWIDLGNVGSVQDFLDSQKGEQGDKGDNAIVGIIRISDTITVDGSYSPQDEGTYANADGLTYSPSVEDKGWKVTFIRADGVWYKDRIDLSVDSEAINEIIQGKEDSQIITIPFDISGYYLLTDGSLSGNPYGHKRTDKFLLEKYKVLNWGVNAYTAVRSSAILNTYNLNGSFKSNIVKNEAGKLNMFREGTYKATEDVLIGLSDYTEGNFGVAYAYYSEQSYNYRGLLSNDNELNDHEHRIDLLETKGAEYLNFYERGFASKEYSNSKKFGILTAGQSNTAGRVPLSTQPPSWYLNEGSPGSLTNIKHWDNISKIWRTFYIPNLWAYDTQVYHQLSNYLGEDIHVVKYAMGGTAISELGTNGGGYWDPYFERVPSGIKLTYNFEKYIRQMMMSAEYSNIEIKAFLWHQGEGDSTSLAAPNYYFNFKNIISYIRGVVGNPLLPVVFGTISEASLQYNSLVDAAQRKIALEDDFAFLVDMKDATLLDPYHFDGVSSEYLGNQIFNIIKDF